MTWHAIPNDPVLINDKNALERYNNVGKYSTSCHQQIIIVCTVYEQFDLAGTLNHLLALSTFRFIHFLLFINFSNFVIYLLISFYYVKMLFVCSF